MILDRDIPKMRINGILSLAKANWRQFIPAFIIVLNTFVWYTLSYQMLSQCLDNLAVTDLVRMVLYASYFLGFAGFAVLGAIFLRHSSEKTLSLWILGGAVVTAFSSTMPYNSYQVNGIITFLLGASLGIGFPSCLAYFAGSAKPEIRGTFGGLVWCAVGVLTLVMAVPLSLVGVSVSLEVLAAWRAVGLIAFFVASRGTPQLSMKHGPVTYTNVFRRRDVMLYLIPWIMFSIINFAEAPIFQTLVGNLYFILSFIEFALIGVCALLGGIFADILGRKRVIITGFVVLGVGYAVLSFSQGLAFSQYLFTVCDGVAWGMFSSVFLITLWGDLAQDRGREKYYVVGGLPFLLASFLEVVVNPYVESIAASLSFSLASFFLFAAVLPLIYAPETLPEKRVREIELQGYLEEAIKIKEKHT
jgi:MFS family permease